MAREFDITQDMEDSSFQAPASQFNYSPAPTPGKSKKILKIIIFAIILVGLIWGVQKLFSGGSKETKQTVIIPTPTEYQFPTDTPTPVPVTETVKPTAVPTLVPTTKAVNPVDSATGLDRSNLSVEVQNGSGETGAASKGSDILKSFGYKVIATANADNFDYVDATIKVKSTKSNFLSLLKKDLGFSYTIGSASADLDSSSTADAVVIIGK